MKRYLLYLLQLFLAPSQGWKDIELDDCDESMLERRGFLPFALLSAVSVFMQLVYHPSISAIRLLIDCVIELGALIAGYYFAVAVMSASLPSICFDEPSRRRIRVFCLCGLGLYALLGLIRNCMPSDFAIIYFLLIYLAIILWRANDYLDVMPDMTLRFVLLSIICVIMPPLVIELIMI